MNRVWPLAVMALLVGGCGRTASPKRSAPPPEPSFRLNQSESALAQALALFVHGLILESAPATNSQAHALDNFREASRIVPGVARVRNALLTKLLRLGKRSEALDLLERMSSHDPENMKILRDLALLSEQFREFTRAGEAYRKIELFLSGTSSKQAAEARAARVRCLFRADQDEKAISLMGKDSGEYQKHHAAALSFMWARHFASVKQFSRALPCIQTAIRLYEGKEVGRSELLEFKGLILEELGEPERAMAAFRESLEQDRSRLFPAVKLALLENDSDPERALRDLAETLAHAPDNIAARGAMASLLLDTDQPLEALEHLRHAYNVLKATQRTPSVAFFAFLSSLLIRNGRQPEAFEVLEEGMATHPEAHVLRNDLAYLWSESGVRLDEAKALAREALAKDPGNGAYLDTMGWIEYKQGEYNKALLWLMKAVGRLPDDPTVLDHIGDTLLALERTPEATAYWLRSFSLNPDETVGNKLRSRGIDPATAASAHRTGDEPDPPVPLDSPFPE